MDPTTPPGFGSIAKEGAQMRGLFKMTRFPFYAAVLLLAFAPLQGVSNAQQESGDHGYAEVGLRQFVGDRASSKFSEYRDLPKGFFIKRFDFRLNSLFGGKHYFSYRSRETLEKDQTHLVTFGMYGKYQGQFLWDQTPHYFSNTVRFLYNETAPGVYTLPLATRARLQTTPADFSSFLAGAQPFNPRLRRDSGLGNFVYTPNGDWTFRFSYSREKQTGTRPFGTTTNGFTNGVELPEPIDYRTQLVEASAEYVQPRWTFQIGYKGSFFQNNIGQLVWDNPFRTSDLVNRASTGRIDLYPDNSAHYLTIAGAVNISKTTRFMASILWGWMRQNDPFLPFTTNTAILNVPALPAASLNGKKDTLAMNYTLSTKAIPFFPITVRYKSYDYDNDTDPITFPGYVVADGNLSTVVRRSTPYAYKKKEFDANVSWTFLKNSSFTMGYDWERMDREHRNVDKSDEHSVGFSLDLIPKKWVLFRTSYRHSNRRPATYEESEFSFPNGEPANSLPDLQDLRRFDQAARVRDRGEILLQIDPLSSLSLAASYGTGQNNYTRSLYGMLKDINYNYSFDISYSPHSAIVLFGDYTREKYTAGMRSRQRNPPAGANPANDSPNNDWVRDMRDFSDTWDVGASSNLFNNRVQLEGFYSLSAGTGRVRTQALGSPSIPGFLVTTAQNYPNTSNRMHQVVASVRFKFGELYPKFEYRFEKYQRNDYQIGGISPFMGLIDGGASTSAYLGADVPGYRVHILAASIGFRF